MMLRRRWGPTCAAHEVRLVLARARPEPLASSDTPSRPLSQVPQRSKAVTDLIWRINAPQRWEEALRKNLPPGWEESAEGLKRASSTVKLQLQAFEKPLRLQ